MKRRGGGIKKKKREKKVLLVDDEVDFVDTLAQRLKMRELLVDTVYDGEQALSFIKKTEPDVIVLDLKMPGLHGIEVLRGDKGLVSPDTGYYPDRTRRRKRRGRSKAARRL